MVRIPYENWNLIKHTPEFWADYDDNISMDEREIGVIHFSEYADPNNPDPNNLKYFTAIPKFLLENFKNYNRLNKIFIKKRHSIIIFSCVLRYFSFRFSM